MNTSEILDPTEPKTNVSTTPKGEIQAIFGTRLLESLTCSERDIPRHLRRRQKVGLYAKRERSQRGLDRPSRGLGI